MRRLSRSLPPVLVAIALLWPLPFVAPIRPPNELSRVYQARAIVEDHSLNIDGMVKRHGLVGDLSRFDGHLYPNKAPGVSLLGAAVYWLQLQLRGGDPAAISLRESLLVLEKVLLGLPSLLLFLILRRMLRKEHADSRFAANAAALGWLLGSSALIYGLLLYGHQLAAVLLFGAHLTVLRAHRRRSLHLMALAGLLGGLGLLTEYTLAPALLVVALHALLGGLRHEGDRKTELALARVGAALLGALLPFTLLLGYHQLAFGGVFQTPYAHLATEGLAALHRKGLMGLQAPSLNWLGVSLFGPQGLLSLSPFFLLALPGFYLWWRNGTRRGSLWVHLGVVGVYLLFTSAWDPSIWGWVVGPRHLTPMLPFLAAPLARSLAWLRDRPGRAGPRAAGLGVGLMLPSMLLFPLAAISYPHLPPELDNGLTQLWWPLLRRGLALDNLGIHLAPQGSVSPLLGLVPYALAIAGSLAIVALLLPGRASWRGRLEAAALAGALASTLLLAQCFRGAPASTKQSTLAFVVGHYDPPPSKAVGTASPPRSPP